MACMIKDQLPKFITEEEAEELRSLKPGGHLMSKIEGVPLDVITRFAEMLGVEPHEDAYVRMSHREQGHKWHKDTGSNNHMPWCSYGGSIMLSKDYEFVGGGFHYREGEIEQPRLSLTYHSSDVEHMVQPHQGLRLVFLMFICCQN